METLTTFMEALRDGIYIINEDYTVEYMNKTLRDAFGDGVGKKCFEAINELEEVCPWCRAEEVFVNKRMQRWELHVDTTDRDFEVTEFPLANEDGTMRKLAIFRDTTSFKRQREKLQVTEEDYQRLFRSVDCGVYISSKEGRFLDANPALLKMLGYESKDEFLNLDIQKDIYLRPEDRARFQQLIERNGRVSDYEIVFKRRDQSPVQVLITANVRYDTRGHVKGYEGIIVDQSEHRRMEARLREANDFFNKIISSSPNGIMAADMRGNMIIWNRAAEGMLGYRAEEVIDKMNIVKVYPEGMAKEVMRMLRSDDFGGKGILRSYPLTAIKRDGNLLEANLSAAVIYDEKGKEQATVGIMVDLKDRLEMERQLQATQEQLLQSEKLAAMGRLTSQVAHELNNPLYGIMNTLELLKTEIPHSSKRRKLLEMALSETVRLTDMLKKMLIFSKPDQEKKQKAEINNMLDEILLLYSKQLWEYSVKLKTDLGEGLGPVFASKNQLRQVFLNMINNARDAMPDGGELTISTREKDGMIHTVFADTGQGIKEENLDKIFEAFFTTKDSVKGVGLGLSVCYGFIKDHGGDITVTSKVGEGTAFDITLPVYSGEEEGGESEKSAD